MRKVLFYQTKDEKLSINLLFNVIRQNLPNSLQFATVYFSYAGASILKRIQDVIVVGFKSRKCVNHVIGDFNYATYFMPQGKTVLTIHDLYRLQEHNRVKAFIFKWCWLHLPVYKSRIVTTVSEHTKSEILRYINCPPLKIRVIYNCIDAGFVYAPKQFNKSKPVLLQVGTRANKNLERLIIAIATLNCRLDIIGQPTTESIKMLEQYNINYTWQDNLSVQQIIQKYIDCDMLVFVSTFEGFGLPVIEANAIGRPVVTSNISAMPEIAGDAACLVNPFETEAIYAGIRRIIDDDGYRQNLVAAGLKNKQRFDAKKIANQYYELYKEVDAAL